MRSQDSKAARNILGAESWKPRFNHTQTQMQHQQINKGWVRNEGLNQLRLEIWCCGVELDCNLQPEDINKPESARGPRAQAKGKALGQARAGTWAAGPQARQRAKAKGRAMGRARPWAMCRDMDQA